MLGAVAGISITLVVVSEEEESPDGWQESDSNADGEVDEWIIFKDGKFLKWERDNNFDGRRDDWTEFEDGVPVRSRKDTVTGMKKIVLIINNINLLMNKIMLS